MENKIANKIKSIINCFEMGSPHLIYEQITLLHDGPNDVLQFTGSFGVTERYNLKKLILLYIDNHGKYASDFFPYLKNMGKIFTLANDSNFKALWVKASKEDQIMKDAQDEIFDLLYFKPAEEWSKLAEFEHPLSYCVIADSFLHSGSIMTKLRNRFPEVLPNKGGDEKEWIKQYTNVRLAWLQSSSNEAVRTSSYRVKDLIRIINSDDWELDNPVKANDIIVY